MALLGEVAANPESGTVCRPTPLRAGLRFRLVRQGRVSNLRGLHSSKLFGETGVREEVDEVINKLRCIVTKQRNLESRMGKGGAREGTKNRIKDNSPLKRA
jgi:hypothetical protein